MPISFKLAWNSSLVQKPFYFLSNILKASNKLKSDLNDNYFFISSISRSEITYYFNKSTKNSSSSPFIGEDILVYEIGLLLLSYLSLGDS